MIDFVLTSNLFHRETCCWLFSFNIVFLNQKNSIIINIRKINKMIREQQFFIFPTKEIGFDKIRKIKFKKRLQEKKLYIYVYIYISIKKIIYHNLLKPLMSSITIYFLFQRRSTKIREKSKSTQGERKENSQEQDGFIQGKKVGVRKETWPFHQLYYSRSYVSENSTDRVHVETSINFLQTMVPEMLREKIDPSFCYILDFSSFKESFLHCSK